MAKGENYKRIDNAVLFFAEKYIKVRNEHNFNELFNSIENCLRRYIKSIVKDDYATSDVFSRVMELVYFKEGDFQDRPRSFLKWIYLVAFRTSVSYMRGELGVDGKYKRPDLLDRCHPVSYPDDDSEYFAEQGDNFDICFNDNEYIKYDENELEKEIYDALVKDINNMDKTLSEVMTRRFIDGKKLAVISDELGIPLHTVKDDIRKGKRLLKMNLERTFPIQYKIYSENLIRC